MHYANPSTIGHELRPRMAGLHLTFHACERTLSRTGLDGERLRSFVARGGAVILPWQSETGNRIRTYHLLYNPEQDAFFVAVLAHAPAPDASPCVVTVLTQEQFENDAGSISTARLRTAAFQALDPVTFRAWEMRYFDGVLPPARYRVTTWFRRDDDAPGARPAQMVFHNAPVCRDFVETHSLEQAAGHPGFLDWYRQQAEQHGVPIERVLAIRIADTHPVELDVSTPALSCSCCPSERPVKGMFSGFASASVAQENHVAR
ncbi:hypothetical protein A8H39_01945 [Paraburkholderia fungorum]|uniref:hypothetical protein n=1 Tax=Paraburkholderia fungorum TaxID=134537 RepID=UPI00048933BD|nr:hypothetical protein [Paraburkholderia fungorum]PNE59934.1 hypothetical protein A8H39_01945 [Paraburkholderia fungorum]